MAVDPYTMLMIGQSVMGFVGAQQEYKRAEYDYAVNRHRAAEARDVKVQSLNSRAIQEAEAAAGRKFDVELAALQEAESRVVVSGESGLAGKTEELKATDVTARELRAKDVIGANLGMVLDQIEDEKLGVNTEMQQRIESYPRGQKPNIITHAIGGLASAYAAELDVAGNAEGSFLHSIGLGKAKTNPNFITPKVMPKSRPASPAPSNGLQFFSRNF